MLAHTCSLQSLLHTVCHGERCVHTCASEILASTSTQSQGSASEDLTSTPEDRDLVCARGWFGVGFCVNSTIVYFWKQPENLHRVGKECTELALASCNKPAWHSPTQAHTLMYTGLLSRHAIQTQGYKQQHALKHTHACIERLTSAFVALLVEAPGRQSPEE